MSEEKNDNLQDADGNLESKEQEVQITDNEDVTLESTSEVKATDTGAETSETDIAGHESAPQHELTVESNGSSTSQAEEMSAEMPETEADTTTEIVEEPVTEPIAAMPEESENVVAETQIIPQVVEVEKAEAEPVEDENTIISISPEELANDDLVYEHGQDDVINAIANANAEESADETIGHDIPMLDYDSLSMEALVGELEKLVSSERIMAVKDHVEEAKKAFLAKYHHFIDEKKEEWLSENPETTEDFHYHLPLKTKFDQLYNQYRDKKNTHFKSLQTNLKANLETRLAIVEELKNLINPQDNIKDTLKQFNDLRERWKNAGPIPKDKYNHVWNNYHFHVENFYDYLHLDREARDIDFKHNLEQKQKIIARVEELVNEPDINKAFRELQDLHRIWKEDIGPVSRDHREEIWNRFSELTKQMHDKREQLFEKLRGTELENLERKKEIISRIEALAQEKVNSHAAWVGQVEKVEAARNEFFAAGKVPSDLNEETWSAFKNAVRSFNVLKNSFYKEIKKDQNDNLSKKQALVAKAKELQESTDFAATTPVMKKIQEEWKAIGHVPRKYSDKLWAEFRAACNAYFEKLKEQKTEENAEEVEAFEKKKTYLETLRAFEMTGDHKTDLDAIKAHIENWKGFGKVPFGRRHIEGKFNKILDALFEKLSLSKKETDMVRFSNRVNNLAENSDTRKLDNEKIFLMRKIEEVQNEIFQLENNIQFFTNTKNAKKENSIVTEVRKNIAAHKENLGVLKEKLKQLRNLKQE